jgi:hypothetical protein
MRRREAATAAAAAQRRQEEEEETEAETARIAAAEAEAAQRRREAEAEASAAVAAREEQTRAAAAAAAAVAALERFTAGAIALERDEPPARAIVVEAEGEARDFMARAGEASRLNAAAATTNRLMREITVTVREGEDAARQALVAEEEQARGQVKWHFDRNLPKRGSESESSDGEAERAIERASQFAPAFERSSSSEDGIFAKGSDSDDSDF